MPNKADLAPEGYPVFSGYRVVGKARRYHYEQSEIIVVARGVGGTGDIKMTPPCCFLTNLSIAILLDSPEVHKPFLYYQLAATTLWELRTGSAQAQITIERLKDFEIRLPPLAEQRRIAGILSAYDDLIENCQRRIRILEEMARSLYREWFVHFRYPGHETSAHVAQMNGNNPEGWEGRFRDLATIERRGINPFEFPEEEFDHFSIPAFDNGEQPATEAGETIRSGKYRLESSCVLLSKLNPRIPRVWLPAIGGQRRAITSTEFLVLKATSGATREFLYAKCCSEEFAGQFASLAIGTSTSHQRVKPEGLLALPAIVPDPIIIEQFTSAVSPVFAIIHQLRVKIQNLRRTRALLLPQLISRVNSP